jgi:hypothetical protein
VLDQQVEGPKDGRPTDSGIDVGKALQQLVSGERSVGLLNRVHDGTTWPSQAVACVL